MLQKLLVNGIITDSFTGKDKSEIEDFFEESLYIEAVKTAYPEHEIEFNEEEKKGPIIDRIDAMFKRKGYKKLEKWKASNIIIDWIAKQSSEKKISQDTSKKFEKLFAHVNKTLGK